MPWPIEAPAKRWVQTDDIGPGWVSVQANVSMANVKLAHASGRNQNERADALANRGVSKGIGAA